MNHIILFCNLLYNIKDYIKNNKYFEKFDIK